jgi:hypothetical protein
VEPQVLAVLAVQVEQVELAELVEIEILPVQLKSVKVAEEEMVVLVA